MEFSVFEIVCLCVCCLHLIFSFIVPVFQSKKITKICEKCLTSVVEGEEHECNPALLGLISVVDEYLNTNNLSADVFIEEFFARKK